MGGLLALLALSAFGQAELCSPETAAATTVEAVASNPERWLDRCVSISGPVWLTGLYAGVDSFYLADRRDQRGHLSRRNLGHRVGLYSDGADPFLPLRAESWTLTGTVNSCERLGAEAQREEDEINRRAQESGREEIILMLLGGYCHYHSGAVLHIVSRQPGPPQAFERRSGSNAQDDIGTLYPAPGTWPHLRRMHRLGIALRTAIEDGDRPELSRLFGRHGAGRADLDYILTDVQSPFAQVRERNDLPFAVLVEAFDPNGLDIEDRARGQDAFICYCRSEDCTTLWPISRFDTAHGPDHPYACLEVNQDGAGDIYVNVDRRPAPLDETALRH